MNTLINEVLLINIAFAPIAPLLGKQRHESTCFSPRLVFLISLWQVESCLCFQTSGSFKHCDIKVNFFLKIILSEDACSINVLGYTV